MYTSLNSFAERFRLCLAFFKFCIHIQGMAIIYRAERTIFNYFFNEMFQWKNEQIKLAKYYNSKIDQKRK